MLTLTEFMENFSIEQQIICCISSRKFKVDVELSMSKISNVQIYIILLACTEDTERTLKIQFKNVPLYNILHCY